ncbi:MULTISPECIES: DNA methylase [Pseudomonas]|uniref:DNA methylase n=1 Tax=Pseudomonas fulva TaxID=47880 RepID=A0A0D0JJ67_9PSED|nr:MULTISPECIES: DNA methylase [Pseudomonas]KIQ06165.1 DNA methylase [Pseudomonas fulva]
MTDKRITAQQLGLKPGLDGVQEAALFKWLLASFLFAKPIQQSVAERAYRVIVEQRRVDTPSKLVGCSQHELVRMLGQARYVRYDLSTAERLLKLGRKLLDEYDGELTTMRLRSPGPGDFARRLMAFEGIGPKTVEIFMAEAEPGLYGSSSAG